MEVKTQKSGTGLKLNIYIDDVLWKTVKSSYFERRIPRLIKSGDFKDQFIKLEKKKALEIASILLEKRSYLKKEWVAKMELKLFSLPVIHEIFDEYLSPFFNEEEEVRLRLEVYYSKGKGVRWIEHKMRPHLSLSNTKFQSLIEEIFSKEKIIQNIRDIEEKRELIAKKGREKTIAFFLRRGFSYNDVATALFSNLHA